MFCPNCGAQNQDTATACAKCGFALKAAVAAPKFKGTMLMMNAPTAGKPATPAAAAPPAAAPPAAAPPGPPAAAAQVAPKPKLKGTM
ncbi:MAG TPA: zinc ribbon domain-containing protein, partial [Polyangiaceae bacterium]